MMAPVERDAPVDRPLRHQHSSSIGAIVPMWDSSDPERAPPPLPMNPQSPGVGPSRSGTSLAIQSAHAALTEKAREHALVPSLAKRMNDTSPERALVQRTTSPHKRMQSMQPGSVRDLSLMIEGSRDRDSANSTPRGSPEKDRSARSQTRPQTPTRGRDYDRESRSAEKENTAPGTPTPMAANLSSMVRPSVRKPPQSILGENTPPQSATMLALQNMPSVSSRDIESPLANVTNNSAPMMKPHPSTEHLSNQLITLTNIATALQKEMSQLSRRSRDNATDLMSLKEATHARDEDIRKSLRELALNSGSDTSRYHRDTYTGGLYLDNKPFNNMSPGPGKMGRPISLPRIPSPNSFAASIDRESIMSTPSLVGGESSPATMALLEKIIRDMGTKDGQESIVGRLSELADRLAGMASADKVEELIHHLRISSEHPAHPTNGGRLEKGRSMSFSSDDSGSKISGVVNHRVEKLMNGKDTRRPSVTTRVNDALNDDIVKVIRAVKDSVAQAGGMTAEVKALVRELRGEVLGMGREISRKLDDWHGKSPSKSETASRAELARIVEEGLEQIRVYMAHRLRDHRRVSSEIEKPAIDYQEIYNALRTALSDSEATRHHDPKLSRDDVIEAVKDAWENYKPEIEIQQIGLERDEVLDCLKEGLEQYAPRQETPQGATRDEVFQAIVEGLKHFVPPQVDTPASISRDEVIEAVRECLEDFEFPIAPSNNDLTRDDVLDAVKEGINSTHSTALVPHGGENTEIIERLHDIMQYMREEFKAVSEEAKQNVAANGRDTEQVLDATRDGFDQLRTHMEGYVNQAVGTSSHEELMSNLENGFEQLRAHMDEFVEKVSGPSGQDELMANIASNLEKLRAHVENPADRALNTSNVSDQDELMTNLTSNFDQLREHMEGYVDKASGASNQEELMSNVVNSFDIFKEEVSELVGKASDGSRDMIRQEIESLRDTVNSSLVPHVPQMSDNRDVLEAIRDSIERIRGELLRPHAGTTDILDALHEGFSDLRLSIEKVADKPADLTANDEILDALKSGLDGVQTNIDSLRENNQDKAVATVATAEEVTSTALIPADLVKHGDIKNLEVMMIQMRTKMESMEAPQSQPPAEGLSKDDLAELEEMLKNGLSKEDLNEMEEMLRNMQESMAGMSGMSSSRDKDGEPSGPPANPDDAATKEDVQAIETILRNTKARLEDLADGEQSVRKDHIDAVEALVLETKDSLAALTSQLETVSRKEDLLSLESLVTQITTSLDEAKERAEKSLDDPDKVTKTHVAAVAAAVLDVKALVEQMVNSGIAALPSKDDLKNLEDAVTELKDNSTMLAESNAAAFEEKHAGVGERVTEVKAFLEEFQGLVKDRLETGGNAVESLGKLLEGLSETVHRNADVGSNLKEMFELVKTEFEESKSSVVGAKMDTDEKIKESTEALGNKLEGKIGELVTKYDEFQLVLEDRSKTSEERDEGMKAAMVNTNTIAEELKVLIDTLGSTVTDSLEKMEEASKTVFEKVETLYGKTEENHADGKNEHQMTRDHVKQAISAVEGLQGHVGDYQPKILESIKEVLLIVGQHYEHSRNSENGILRKIEDAKPEPLLLPPPPDKYDDSLVQSKLDKLDGEVLTIRENLDSGMHSKLDKLVDHTNTANKAYAQLYTLDMVHQQVVKTAADISEFLSSQKQRINDEHEDREKTLQETTIQLERSKVEKDQVETNLLYLKDEEAQLRDTITTLRAEQDSLTRQKTRLTADVSSLETALHLRREELHAMDARAEGLERRILEGVLDHSRALLMTKSSLKGREAMSRKRVPGARSSLGPSDELNSTPKQAKPRAVNIAVNSGRASLVPQNPASAGRRILSLSQITNNVPTGGLKRSQSVRTPAGTGVRKGSWAPGKSGPRKGYGDLDMDKENVDLVRESDEEAREDSPVADSEPDTPIGDETVLVGGHANGKDPGDKGGEEDPMEMLSEPDDGDAEETEGGESEAGTTVMTGAATESGYISDEQSHSEWAESAVGVDSVISESIADTDSIAGEGEVLVYNT
ncbi:uncharacterized protein GGS22DRAFT_143581 [Annulohypoxylon maeteangense]|uniref:uncharacterized protein n=1 Tax=Annulohypoxylon maeteangense TaxID=1927788 RepID=UPI002008E75C|nr:uncharacterized protein GGS22DRAFT_143581 [Annulohypoxylon maeteangense]KAI0884505.1 hypothetical protein GGS22DRAFT_143581 [Annulohypoxylon maeteangense]